MVLRKAGTGMARYTHPSVDRTRDDPDPDATMTVVLVVEEGYCDYVLERVNDVSEAIVEYVSDRDMIVVTLPETSIGSVLGMKHIESIAPDEEMEILA